MTRPRRPAVAKAPRRPAAPPDQQAQLGCPPPDYMPRPTLGPPPPLEWGAWVVVDVVPPEAAEPAWAPPDLRLGRVTDGPLYDRGPGGFVVGERWKVDSLTDFVKRYRMLQVDLASETHRARALAADPGRLIVAPRADLLRDLVPLVRIGRLAAAYLADPRVQSEATAAPAAPVRELAAAVAELEGAAAAAEDFRRRQLPALLAGLRDAGMCAAVGSAVEPALAAALGEIRRQDGPDYLLREAHGEGLRAARWHLQIVAHRIRKP